MNSLEILQKTHQIVGIQEIVAEKITLSPTADEKLKQALVENSKEINVFKISYISEGHTVVGYIVEPKIGENLPCVIVNRGGSGNFGVWKDEQMFAGKIARLVRGGYVVIASQYSGNDGGEGTDQFGGEDLKDILNLKNILEAYPRVDISRIGMIGGSRGGMMTLLALKESNWIKAAVIEYANTDLFDVDNHRPEFQKHLEKMFGGSEIEKQKRSAVLWTDKLPKNVPILVLHGTADWRVNPMDSIRLAEGLYKNKVPYRLIMYEGGVHGLPEFRKEATDETIKWLDKYVKNRYPLPNLELHGE